MAFGWKDDSEAGGAVQQFLNEWEHGQHSAASNLDNGELKLLAQLKWNWNKTVLKQFWNSFETCFQQKQHAQAVRGQFDFDSVPNLFWPVTQNRTHSLNHERTIVFFLQKCPFISAAHPIKRDKWQTVIINFNATVVIN